MLLLAQLRRSVDQESATTHTRVCYIRCWLLQHLTGRCTKRVLNAAARVLTGTHKFDRGLSWLLHTELHWLDIPEQVTYKLGMIMFGCQHGRAPQCLIDCCVPVSDVASRQHFPSVSRRLLVVPHHHLSSYDCRAFALAGLTVWTLSRIISGIQSLLQTTSSGCWKRFCSQHPVQLAH